MSDSTPTSRSVASTAAEDLVSTCLGRTCLKWSADGELTSLDLALGLERLAQADQQMTPLQPTVTARSCAARV